jgi:hypothetical protein
MIHLLDVRSPNTIGSEKCPPTGMLNRVEAVYIVSDLQLEPGKLE